MWSKLLKNDSIHAWISDVDVVVSLWLLFCFIIYLWLPKRDHTYIVMKVTQIPVSGWSLRTSQSLLYWGWVAWMMHSCSRPPAWSYAHTILWHNSSYWWPIVKGCSVLALQCLSRQICKVQGNWRWRHLPRLTTVGFKRLNRPESRQGTVMRRQRPSTECLTVP